MILKSIIFGASLTIAIVLITILMGVGADLSVPNIAYSQSSPSVPSVPTSDSINNANNNKAVILTFDDGYKSQYTNAKPILDKYGYKATFYIVCNNVGGGEGQVHPNVKMTWEDIIALYNEDTI
ncbi:MAG TPA: polysaccharide deacetylase family protein [Nitrososphaeraceae archaeon]|nr:polysaccharide deacetylase family protein [Nitrososphaeraceae archaeon]